MQEAPRWYYRINSKFNKFYAKFWDEYDLENNLFNTFMNLKNVYQTYWQSLRDILKDDGEDLYFPDEILKKAEQKGIITDSEVWLRYIECLNVLLDKNNDSERNNVMKEIILKFSSYIELPNKVLNKIVEDANFSFDRAENIVYPATLHKYKENDFALDEKVYAAMQKCFKSNPSIKKVWLFGSRIKPNPRKCADIDLLVDAGEDMDNFNNLQKIFDDLRIPVSIDAKSIHNPEDSLFVNEVFRFSPILIYEYRISS